MFSKKGQYLLVELVDDAIGPLQVQLFTLQWTIDICQLDAHLAHQETVVFIGPIDTGHALFAHLGTSGDIIKGGEPLSPPQD